MRYALLLSFIVALLVSTSLHAQDGTYTDSPRTYTGGSSGPHYGFKIYLPSGYSGNSNNYPLVLFVHGDGERGAGDSSTELAKIDTISLPNMLANGADFNAIIICPQATTTAWFWDQYLADLVIWAKQNYRVDPNRVIITGLSSGGSATWITSDKYPGLFSAVVPIAGATAYNNTGAGVVNQGLGLRRRPVWSFHSDNDVQVYPSRTANWTNAIAGGLSFTTDCRTNKPAWPGTLTDATAYTVWNSGTNAFTWSTSGIVSGTETPRWTLFAQGAHGLWSRPYQDAGLWTWMLAQTSAPVTMAALPYDFSILPSTPRALSITVDCSTMHPDYIKLSATSSATGVIANSGLVFSGTGSSRTLTITPAASTGSATITVVASDWSRTSSDPGIRTVTRTFIAKVQTTSERITDLEGQLASANATIAAQGIVINQQTLDLATANATIATRNATIAARDATIASQAQTITAHEQAIADLNADLAQIHTLSAP